MGSRIRFICKGLHHGDGMVHVFLLAASWRWCHHLVNGGIFFQKSSNEINYSVDLCTVNFSKMQESGSMMPLAVMIGCDVIMK
jgi:hypothetical protein